MNNSTIIDSTATPAEHMTLLGVLRIPAVRQISLLIGVAAAVAAGFAVINWSQTPGYTQLYGDLDSADASQVIEALRSADIKYKLNAGSGNVMVPQDSLHEARLELASQGLPSGAAAGMEAIQEQTSFGVSQFMEGARYQYALEAELAKTITHLGSVRDARVHLALPKQSAFIRDQKAASASVLLQLFRGRSLEATQASAIVHLIASSVPNLAASNVTLVDQQGRLLSSESNANQWGNEKALKQFEVSEKIEKLYASRIEDLLTPLVGAGRVRAKVVASLDFTVIDETREAYDPARSVIRSEQINQDERLGNSAGPQGVPGALSNQPPETAVAAGTADAQSESGNLLNSSRSSVRNFEVDRTISRTQAQSGTIKRLSVAVLVDGGPVEDANGSEQQLDEADIAQFTSLVKEAVGFDEARGDTVVVVNAAFRSVPEPIAAEAPPFWEKPILRDSIKQGVGVVLILVLAFGLVKPMLRGLVASNMTSSAQYIAAGGANALTAAGMPNMLGANPAIAAPGFDEKIAAAKNMTNHDPARVAQVVKKWVTADD
jgi:flagellar M-ring protein FliF